MISVTNEDNQPIGSKEFMVEFPQSTQMSAWNE